MKRRAFLSIVPALGVAAAMPSIAIAQTLSPLEKMQQRRLTNEISRRLHDIYFSVTTMEPNDEITRDLLRKATAEYMDDLEYQRVIYEWVGICDETNNPVSVVNSGVVGCDIWWRPVGTTSYLHFSMKPTAV